MKKKSLLAIALSLTLVLGACGGASNNDNYVHNTETEIGTEHVHETETELVAMTTETVDVETESVDFTEVETESETTEKVESTEKETEKSTESKSDSKKDDSKTDTSKKDESSKNESSSNSGSSTGNGNNSSSNTGSNNSGSNNNDSSNTGSNNSGSTSGGSSSSGNTSNSESKEPEPTPETCSHTNTGTYGGNGSTHSIICIDCLLNKNEVIVLRTESCDFSSGSCKCGVVCPHASVSWDSSSSQSGHCNMTCNVCGIVYNNVHAISWNGSGHSCSRCGGYWPCEHTYTAIRGSWDTGHAWYCTGCGAHLYDEGHSFANGSCGACGWADPSYNPNPTPEPTPDPAPTNEALPEDVVTDVTP